MEVYWKSSWLIVLLGVTLLTTTLQGVQGEVEVAEGPSESECRPYVERALKELETVEPGVSQTPDVESSKEDLPTVEISNDDSDQKLTDGDDDADDRKTSNETNEENESQDSTEDADPTKEIEDTESQEKADSTGENIDGDIPAETAIGNEGDKAEDKNDSGDSKAEEDSKSLESAEEGKAVSVEDQNETVEEFVQKERENETNAGSEGDDDTQESNDTRETEETVEESVENLKIPPEESPKPVIEEESQETQETVDTSSETEEKVDVSNETHESHEESGEATNSDSDQQVEGTDKESIESETDDDKNASGEKSSTDSNESSDDNKTEELAKDSKEQLPADSKEDTTENTSTGASKEDETEPSKETRDSNVESNQQDEEVKIEIDDKNEGKESSEDDSKPENDDKGGDTKDTESEESSESAPEEDLMLEIDIPEDLRSRDHVEQLLKLDKDSSEAEEVVNRVSAITLKELKRLYENAIKPLEILYKYRDLSNRHFGDSEIFSKPLILFMGPWSGGKSSIINYLLDNEYNETSLRTGAEPSPAYFNILMHGNEPEILDGTQLAADHTFSGLQKFGQGLEERLRGVKLPSSLLEKVNVVEIPGILEVRKQVSRIFPFNDACQWFIDRADIIFLVYDPSKLDVGPETEAILDQLKGREHQTRIILNKADQVKPEELMRVQGALIWNISPLMSSAQPPVMYTTSLWSRPYESWAPVRLLQAQERAFLRDLRTAIEKRIDNKIASARRFAVRVRNHAKMVDCYLTTYYNHKSVFGNRKQVADQIIEHPQDYHIYEGLSTLTNISRYDLPDPDVYKDFFRLNPLYEFQQLSATCTYFRGCPINRLDIAIAYDLPELVGKHKRLVETALTESHQGPAKVPGS